MSSEGRKHIFPDSGRRNILIPAFIERNSRSTRPSVSLSRESWANGDQLLWYPTARARNAKSARVIRKSCRKTRSPAAIKAVTVPNPVHLSRLGLGTGWKLGSFLLLRNSRIGMTLRIPSSVPQYWRVLQLQLNTMCHACIWYVQAWELKLYFYPSAGGFYKKLKNVSCVVHQIRSYNMVFAN